MKTHWKKLAGKNFLTGEDLVGKEVTLTIETAKREPVVNVQESIKKREPVYEDKPVMYFKGTEKKLVVNTTNFKTIVKVLKSPYIEDWVGKEITLIPVNKKFFGELQDVVRIKQDFSNIKV